MSRNSKQKRPSQRQRLLARPRPTVQYRLLVDPDGVEQAQAQLLQAQQAVRQARINGSDADVGEAQKRSAAAEQAVNDCYETVVLRALPLAGEVTIESLIAVHPPTAEQMARAKEQREQAKSRGETPPDWPAWNDDTFRPALLAACADSDMTAEDWRAFLAGHVSQGEARGLWAACLSINSVERAADPLVLPKGWMATGNWR